MNIHTYKLNFNSISGLYQVREPCPVSYTHLDVYKRQRYERLAEAANERE
ncbi:putative translational regulatory protein ArgL [Klebsiella pneumoniae]